jgi:hypothetical protein
MRSHPFRPTPRGLPGIGSMILALAWLAVGAEAAAQERRYTASQDDPRASLGAGWMDAAIATRNMELVANRERPEGFYLASDPGNGDLSNTDLAFRGDLAVVGNYSGFMVYDISDPGNPGLRLSVYCPGGQGDVSIHGDLVFMSAEQMRGRVDCGAQGVAEAVSAERFRGVRIFDIADLDNPRQVAAVQTCRGSHTHTLVTDPRDREHVYVYVSGTGVPRPTEEMAECTGPDSEDDPNTSYSRIEVIRVPLARPREARIVSQPRIFADPETGALAGLWRGGDHGPGTQPSRATMQCHDITVYPAIGLAAGACSGNGILLDVTDPANPVRLHQVTDPNFAAWHSATFSNDGSVVVFTDEWGGGGSPRCRATDPMEWGANAIFRVVDRKLELVSYYKLPAAQSSLENCVAHNGSLVPVPGRDIKAQAWYQGGISVFDFTDPANPFEIAYFDRGPMSATDLVRAGHWSAYWHNGYIYGAEKARGLDVLRLTPSEHLTQNEIDAANLIRFQEFNPQMQPQLVWPASFAVSRAYLDQLARNDGLPGERRAQIAAELDRIERLTDPGRKRAGLTQLATRLEGDASGAGDPRRVRALAESVRKLAEASR